MLDAADMKALLRTFSVVLAVTAAACNPNVMGGGDGGSGAGGPSTGGCFSAIYEWCAGGIVHGTCCAPGECAPPPEYCDLGNATCYLGPCTDYPDAGASCDAGTISASSFDQTCQSDADCVAVFDGSLCGECRCPSAAINQDALSAYTMVLDTAPPGGLCGCPASPPPVCANGACTLQ